MSNVIALYNEYDKEEKRKKNNQKMFLSIIDGISQALYCNTFDVC